MMDKIIEGKKRKILGIETRKKKAKKPLDPKVQEALDNIEINRQELLEEEMAKLPKLDKNEALIQTHTGEEKGSYILVINTRNKRIEYRIECTYF